MISLFISAALYLFFRRFFPPTEASARDNEYLHCIQTHGQKNKTKKTADPAEQIARLAARTLSPLHWETEKTRLWGVKNSSYTHIAQYYTHQFGVAAMPQKPQHLKV